MHQKLIHHYYRTYSCNQTLRLDWDIFGTLCVSLCMYSVGVDWNDLLYPVPLPSLHFVMEAAPAIEVGMWIRLGQSDRLLHTWSQKEFIQGWGYDQRRLRLGLWILSGVWNLNRNIQREKAVGAEVTGCECLKEMVLVFLLLSNTENPALVLSKAWLGSFSPASFQ